MSAISERVLVDDVLAEILAQLKLLDPLPRRELLDGMQQIIEEQRAERRAERRAAKRALPPRRAGAPYIRGLRAVTN